MSAHVTLITPTGGRQGSFALVERAIAEQTYHGDMQWIVVDDCEPATVCTMGQTYLRRERQPSEPPHTLPCQMLAALPLVAAPKILMIEDDEWYAPGYVETMVDRLEVADLVGEGHIRSFCLGRRAWNELHLKNRASFCRTGFRDWLLEFLAALCDRMSPWIDMALWSEGTFDRRVWCSEDSQNIALKNVPGRRTRTRMHGWKSDPDFSRLAAWMGNEWAGRYRRLANGVP